MTDREEGNINSKTRNQNEKFRQSIIYFYFDICEF